MAIQIKELSKSEIEITDEISAEEFDKFWKKAIEELSKNASIPGFRAGNIPEKVLIEKVGEANVLEKAGEMAIQENYLRIVKEKKIEAIGFPKANIIKIAKSSPLGFKIVVAVLPKMTLPEDYKEITKKIMSKEETITVEDKEVDNTLEQLRKMRAQGKELPELNDEFAKSVGKFSGLIEMKNAIKENLKYEKETRAKEKKRIEALDSILKKVEIDIPDVLVEGEKNHMLSEFKSSIESMGLKWEDYLKQLKKTEKEILDGWTEEALKRSKYGLLLRELARAIDLKITDEELEEKIKTFHIPETDAKGNSIDPEKVKDYAYGIIRNEKIFKHLEEL
jgi:FKBP-type peptidyl-prolyl cis-trans isomerase (trigger factor)